MPKKADPLLRWSHKHNTNEELLEMIRHIAENMPTPIYSDPMLPPWLRFPEIPAFRIGWRMGGGEDYIGAFADWLRSKSPEEREQYFETNPPPNADWLKWSLIVRERIAET